MVLLWAGRSAELDASDLLLQGEPVGVHREARERAPAARGRAVEAVGGRLRDAVEVLPRPVAPAHRRQYRPALVAEVVRRLDRDVGDHVGEEAVRLVERVALAPLAGGQVDVVERVPVVVRAEQAGAGGGIDDPRIGRVNGRLEALCAAGRPLGALPGPAVVGGSVHAQPAVGVAAERVVSGDRDQRPALGRGVRDRADGLRRQRVADRVPALARVARLPHTAAGHGGVQDSVPGVVRVVGHTPRELREAVSIGARIVGVVGAERAAAERAPGPAGPGDGRCARLGEARALPCRGRVVGRGVRRHALRDRIARVRKVGVRLGCAPQRAGPGRLVRTGGPGRIRVRRLGGVRVRRRELLQAGRERVLLLPLAGRKLPDHERRRHQHRRDQGNPIAHP